MTFSLRTLLLLFPALIVAYALAYAWLVQAGIGSGAESQPMHDSQRELLCILRKFVEFNFIPYRHASLQKHFDAYLSGKTESIPQDVLKSIAIYCFLEKDPWGNPYRCVLVDDQLHFYSNGQDGISRSAGNDPDDLNYWNTLSNKFYGEQVAAEGKRKQAIVALYFLPVTFGLVVGSWLLARRFVAKRSCRPAGADVC
jgi:hypothetical protein